ncbi:hypothetical protein [Vibrio sp. D431a]|uniref:hypothetical protein n=1 Tax=Vibrio sp. D431a TaxID=2837388 RepID=UPI002552EF46|nr:hypothetical protein [Vibrio sp. D431a]MDK9790102.1 hypothetical protein [Vibrio sp. D431a]
MSFLKDNKAGLSLLLIMAGISGSLFMTDDVAYYTTTAGAHPIESELYPSKEFNVSIVQSLMVKEFYRVCGAESTIKKTENSSYVVDCKKALKTAAFKASDDVYISGIEAKLRGAVLVAHDKDIDLKLMHDTVGEADCVITLALGSIQKTA